MQSLLVGKAWVDQDANAPRGALRMFLSDGTLLMTSCVETYRLARWREIDDRRIEWTEDSARIEGEIVDLTANELRLRIQLRGEVKESVYRPADVPSVCPDLPR